MRDDGPESGFDSSGGALPSSGSPPIFGDPLREIAGHPASWERSAGRLSVPQAGAGSGATSAPLPAGPAIAGGDGLAMVLAPAHGQDAGLGPDAAEAALLESEQRYRNLFENANDIIFIADLNGRLLSINPAAEHITGCAREEALTMPFRSVVAPEYLDLVDELFEAARRGQAVRFELEIVAKDGRRVPLEVDAHLLLRNGQPVGFQGIARDVTERRRWEEERLGHARRLRTLMEETIEAMATTLEMRDPYTAGHARRVADLAVVIAGEMGLAETHIEGIRLAGLVHDIGKVAIPAELLAKPRRLTALEFELVKTHVQIGYDILRMIEFPWPIADAVFQHHERYDGSGYPQGLKGDDIIVEARVLGVADTIAAMSAHRPYRPQLGLKTAFEEVKRNRGVLFDPRVVDACLRLAASAGGWGRRDRLRGATRR